MIRFETFESTFFPVFSKMETVVNFFERLFQILGARFFQNTIVKPHPTIQFHRRHGKNIKVDVSRAVAHRSKDYQHGIVFTQRPINLNEPICLRILQRCSNWEGPLCFGFTDINPALLRSEELERAQILHQRYFHRFWFYGIYSKNCSFLTFAMKETGEVGFRIDSDEEIIIPREEVQMNPAHRLWAVVDIYGSFTSIQVVYHPILTRFTRCQGRQQSLGYSSESSSSENSGSEDNNTDRISAFRSDRPPSPARLFTFDIQIPNYSTIPSSPLYNSPYSLTSPPNLVTPRSAPNSPSHCVICLDEEANTAFIDCGHLCICMQCAKNYWASQGDKDRSCPVCRKTARAYLRIY